MGEMYLNYEGARVYPQKPINDQLTLCKCYVMALGPNANRSNFRKEAVDAALPTLFNIPVVGHLMQEEDGTYRMGSHDMTIELDEDGEFKYKWLTVPFGTVPENCNAHYEEVAEANGSTKTYLVADMILWTGRYPEMLEAKYDDEVYFNHSMEIDVARSNYKDEPGYTTVDEFQFSALCLLGKSDDKAYNVQPCFPSSRVEPYSFSEDDSWKKWTAEFKEEITKAFSLNSPKEEVKPDNEEGVNMEEIKDTNNAATEVDSNGSAVGVYSEPEVAEVAITPAEETAAAPAEETEPETDDATTAPEVTEEVPAEVAEPAEPATDEIFKNESSNLGAVLDESKAVLDECPAVAKGTKVYADMTYKEKRDKLADALEAFDVCTDEECVHYWLDDFCDAFVYVELDAYSSDVYENKMLRIPYSISDDSVVVIDMASAEDVFPRYLTQAEIDTLDAQAAEQAAEFAALQEYKTNKESEERNRVYGAILEEFSDLLEYDEYKEIAKNALSYSSAEELETKLYAVRGKNMKAPVKKNLNEVKIPVGNKAEVKLTPFDKLMAGKER